MIDAFDKPASSAAGDSASEGYSGAAARADHTHAREAADANLSSTAGNIAQIDVADTASAGALTTGARADHQHALPSPAAPTTSAVADAAGAGSATTVARSDHRHGREAFATTADIADVAATESAGTAATVARGDHVHADAAYGAWIGYTPAWTATGTAPALGNGTLVGAYLLIGKTCHYRIQFTSGSTSTYGTGAYRWSLPATSALNIINWPMGTASIVDASAAAAYLGVGILVSTTTVAVLHQSAAGASGSVGQTSPMTFASGDQVYITGSYEVV